MKFLIVAPRFHTNLYYRAKTLQDEGHSVKIIVLYKGKSEFYEGTDIKQIKISCFSKLLLKIISLFKRSKLKSASELRLQSPGKELKKIINSYKPDVILLKAYQNALAIKTLRLAKRKKINVLMLTQTPYNHIKGSEFLFRLNIRLFKFLKVFAYITPIKSNYEVFKNSGINNVYYLPFVYPSETTEIRIPGKEFKILSVGKFQKRKEQLLLLKVFAELKQENYPIKLCLIGEAVNKKYIKTIINFIRKNKLSEEVCVETNMPYEKIKEEYKKYDLFVLPAYNEPAAYSPVEAMANGLPVICSDDNGTKSYIKEGENGYIFKAKNKEDLKEKIRKCIFDKEKLKKMKENALLSARENHNPKDFAKKIFEILK